MSAPLRILQICHKPPRPAVDGGCIAMDSLTTGLLAEGHRVGWGVHLRVKAVLHVEPKRQGNHP